jgi:myotubularin-related protein 6/7/8
MKNPSMNQYLNALDNSSWLQHIKAVLDAAIFIARVNKTRLKKFS